MSACLCICVDVSIYACVSCLFLVCICMQPSMHPTYLCKMRRHLCLIGDIEATWSAATVRCGDEGEHGRNCCHTACAGRGPKRHCSERHHGGLGTGVSCEQAGAMAGRNCTELAEADLATSAQLVDFGVHAKWPTHSSAPFHLLLNACCA